MVKFSLHFGFFFRKNFFKVIKVKKITFNKSIWNVVFSVFCFVLEKKNLQMRGFHPKVGGKMRENQPITIVVVVFFLVKIKFVIFNWAQTQNFFMNFFDRQTDQNQIRKNHDEIQTKIN